MTRKALGRGLSALLGETTEPGLSAATLREVSLSLIDPNPFQPRRVVAEHGLKELADSIQATGVVQPVVLRRSGERYQLIAGERRWRAAALAKLNTVPAIVRELADRDALELALAENILREDLSPLEVAHAFQALNEKFSYSHEQIASRLGMDRSTVTNTLRLLRLPESIQQNIENGLITPGHARALLACRDEGEQLGLAARIVGEHLSVRDAERLAMRPKQGSKSDKDKGLHSSAPDPNVRAASLELERALGTRVKIVGDAKRGRIEISYYSAEDLNRLYERLARAS